MCGHPVPPLAVTVTEGFAVAVAGTVGTTVTTVGIFAMFAVATFRSFLIKFAQTAAVATERFIVAFEYDVFAQLAFKRPVENGNFFRRSQADFGNVVVFPGNDPCMVAFENILEFRADESVQAFHVLDADTFAIGGDW